MKKSWIIPLCFLAQFILVEAGISLSCFEGAIPSSVLNFLGNSGALALILPLPLMYVWGVSHYLEKSKGQEKVKRVFYIFTRLFLITLAVAVYEIVMIVLGFLLEWAVNAFTVHGCPVFNRWP